MHQCLLSDDLHCKHFSVYSPTNLISLVLLSCAVSGDCSFVLLKGPELQNIPSLILPWSLPQSMYLGTESRGKGKRRHGVGSLSRLPTQSELKKTGQKAALMRMTKRMH
ncbi:hypothetical protein MUK42_27120 [Musa troglodytarum]|uniref:Uncharacterized protein n=1 Tax=Musa troglodytarum TaxID=320322 RepID=A0A9E7G1F6_9LILI|nr:hypothetical protein MUK42_27120 [Musa troglodytarum]